MDVVSSLIGLISRHCQFCRRRRKGCRIRNTRGSIGVRRKTGAFFLLALALAGSCRSASTVLADERRQAPDAPARQNPGSANKVKSGTERSRLAQQRQRW